MRAKTIHPVYELCAYLALAFLVGLCVYAGWVWCRPAPSQQAIYLKQDIQEDYPDLVLVLTPGGAKQITRQGVLFYTGRRQRVQRALDARAKKLENARQQNRPAEEIAKLEQELKTAQEAAQRLKTRWKKRAKTRRTE